MKKNDKTSMDNLITSSEIEILEKAKIEAKEEIKKILEKVSYLKDKQINIRQKNSSRPQHSFRMERVEKFL